MTGLRRLLKLILLVAVAGLILDLLRTYRDAERAVERRARFEAAQERAALEREELRVMLQELLQRTPPR